MTLAVAVPGAAGTPQQVPVGVKVFGCVLKPLPPQQQAGPPGMTVRGSVHCDQAHKANFITLLAQKYVPGFSPPPPANDGGDTPDWESRGLPFAGSSTPIRAHHTYSFGETHTLDCNDPAGPLPPGVYRTELQLRFAERKHPHRIRVLAAYSAPTNVTCS